MLGTALKALLDGGAGYDLEAAPSMQPNAAYWRCLYATSPSRAILQRTLQQLTDAYELAVSGTTAEVSKAARTCVHNI